jgi:hypothetical protein
VNFEFKKSFARDLKKKAQGIKLRSRIQEIIHEVDNAENLHEIKNTRSLKLKATIIESGLAIIG